MTRCIDSRSTDVYFNLAAEEYLLKHTQDNWFLLWQAEPSVVIGRHQSMHVEADVSLARERHIKLARRFSGGGAVYQDGGNLNLSFVETVDKPILARYLHRVVRFLKTLGISAETDPRLGIYLDGKKISGSAQSIYKNRILYHCTLLYDTNLETLEATLHGTGNADSTTVSSVRSPVANLRSSLREPIDTTDFREEAFRYFLLDGSDNRRDSLNETEQAEIMRLRDGKYAAAEWIYNKL